MVTTCPSHLATVGYTTYQLFGEELIVAKPHVVQDTGKFGSICLLLYRGYVAKSR